ncbi:MAG: hypothetical protein QF903_06520 [Planctomycetota bacterium]|jgi:hypothetical protein|nr:hypothetical protein [Planctomycetota bacterium]MDP6989115.1 hypothetical protein [Planctomycetota bacterium]
MTRHKRRIKLIKVSLQTRLTMTFVGMAALSLLLEFLLFLKATGQMAATLPNDGAIVWEEMASLLGGLFLSSLGLCLPLIFAVGILTTFRIAGPVYRMEMFLKEIISGADPGRCRLRKGDQLQELCTLLNAAREELEGRGSRTDEPRRREGDEPGSEAA